MPKFVLRKTMVALGAAGMLSFGAAGLGAAGPAGASTVALGPKAQAQFEKHLNCASAARQLGRLPRLEAKFAKKLARLHKAQAAATARGDTKRAAYWQKVITHEQKIEARATGAKARSKAAQRNAMISAKCHVAAPTLSPPSTTT